MMANPSPEQTRDYVPFAIATTGFCIMLGTAVMTAFLLVNRALVRDLAPNAQPDLNQPAATVLVAGSLLSLVVPAITAWTLLAPIGSTYRRGGLATVSAFGAILVSTVSIPLNEWLGRTGLVLFLVLSLLALLLLGRAVSRTRAAA